MPRLDPFVLRALAATVSAGMAVPTVGMCQDGGRTTAVSYSSAQVQAHGTCTHPSLSSDGRFVAFTSHASNLTAQDTNQVEDIFVRDRVRNLTVCASVASDGTPANDRSSYPVISGNGRYVAFISHATNLVPGDTNGVEDVFRHDLWTGQTVRVTETPSGVQQDRGVVGYRLGISADGARVAFSSEALNLVPNQLNPHRDVFVRDFANGTMIPVSVNPGGFGGDELSHRLSLSADGNTVVFASESSNLTVGITNLRINIFAADLAAGTMEVVSRSSQGQLAFGDSNLADVSADGRYVVFDSRANNLVPNDGNQAWDVFLHDRVTGTTTLLSRTAQGLPGENDSRYPVISDEGGHVLFVSAADDIPIDYDPNGVDTDLVRLDLATSRFESVFLSTAGHAPSGSPPTGEISADGSLITFADDSDRLIYGDANPFGDIFVRDLNQRWPLTFCPPGANSLGCVERLELAGSPSAISGLPFTISSSGLLNGQVAALMYTIAGTDERPYLNGTLCLDSPYMVALVTTTGGVGPSSTNCSGSFSFDFNSFLASGQSMGLMVGTAVWVQAFHRDPGFDPFRGATFTDAAVFRIGI